MEVIGDIDESYFREMRNERLFRRDSKEKESNWRECIYTIPHTPYCLTSVLAHYVP